jgi:hypothetical protein
MFDWNRARERRRLVRPGVTFQGDARRHQNVRRRPRRRQAGARACYGRLGIQRTWVCASSQRRDDTGRGLRSLPPALRSGQSLQGRTVVSDVTAIAGSRSAGIAVEVYTFIGSSGSASGSFRCIFGRRPTPPPACARAAGLLRHGRHHARASRRCARSGNPRSTPAPRPCLTDTATTDGGATCRASPRTCQSSACPKRGLTGTATIAGPRSTTL